MAGGGQSSERARSTRLDTEQLISQARKLRVQSQSLVAHAVKLCKKSKTLTHLPTRGSGPLI